MYEGIIIYKIQIDIKITRCSADRSSCGRVVPQISGFALVFILVLNRSEYDIVYIYKIQSADVASWCASNIGLCCKKKNGHFPGSHAHQSYKLLTYKFWTMSRY